MLAFSHRNYFIRGLNIFYINLVFFNYLLQISMDANLKQIIEDQGGLEILKNAKLYTHTYIQIHIQIHLYIHIPIHIHIYIHCYRQNVCFTHLISISRKNILVNLNIWTKSKYHAEETFFQYFLKISRKSLRKSWSRKHECCHNNCPS